jgi:hypothetical protein
MNATPTLMWKEANQTRLTAALAEVRVGLMRFLAIPEEQEARSESSTAAGIAAEEACSTESVPSALDTLCGTFGLSGFERKILLMSAGAELDSRFARLYAAGSRDARCSQATFSLEAVSQMPQQDQGVVLFGKNSDPPSAIWGAVLGTGQGGGACGASRLRGTRFALSAGFRIGYASAFPK